MPTHPNDPIPDRSASRALEGIDIGFPQGAPDWGLLGQVYRGERRSATHPDFNFTFAYLRASQGVAGRDPRVWSNAAGARHIGIPHGYYHAASPDGDAGDAVAEAENFLRVVAQVDLDHGELRPMLDVETRRQNLPPGEPFVRWVLDCLDRVRDGVGIEPLLYTGGPFWDAADGPGLPSAELVARLRAYPLWLAAYVRPEYMLRYVPGVWAGLTPAVWQASGDQAAAPDVPLRLPGVGVSPGSNPVCDRNVLLHPGGLDWLAGRTREVLPTHPATAATPLGRADRAEADQPWEDPDEAAAALGEAELRRPGSYEEWMRRSAEAMKRAGRAEQEAAALAHPAGHDLRGTGGQVKRPHDLCGCGHPKLRDPRERKED